MVAEDEQSQPSLGPQTACNATAHVVTIPLRDQSSPNDFYVALKDNLSDSIPSRGIETPRTTRSLRSVVTMMKPWLSSRPLKIRTIHEVLCEIVEKEGEFKYTVINDRKLLLSKFTFEQIFVAAQLCDTFERDELRRIVTHMYAGQGQTSRGKQDSVNVVTHDKDNQAILTFRQVLESRVPEFFKILCYSTQKHLFNLAYLCLIYRDVFQKGLDESGLLKKFRNNFLSDDVNFRRQMAPSRQTAPSTLTLLLVFITDNKHQSDDPFGYYFKCTEKVAVTRPELLFVNSVYAVFLKHWNKIKLGIAKLKVNNDEPNVRNFLTPTHRLMEEALRNEKTDTFCFSPFIFNLNDPTKDIQTFLKEKDWTDVEYYKGAHKDSSSVRNNNKHDRKIYAMRPSCSLFFDIPTDVNPQFDDFVGHPILKVNLSLGILCSAICEVLSSAKGPRQILVSDSGNGFLPILVASVAKLKLIEDVSVVGLNCPDPKAAEKLATEWGALNVKFRKQSLFKQSGKSNGKLADARLILVNGMGSESGTVNPGACFLDDTHYGGNPCYRALYGTVLNRPLPSEETLRLYKSAIMHSLTFFPKTDTIVYFTESMLPEENEQVVTSALTDFNEKYNINKDFKLEVKSYADRFPMLSFEDMGAEKDQYKFMKLKPQREINGCFMAIINRGSVTRTAAEILAKALQMGLLTKKDLGQSDASETESTKDDSFDTPKSARSGRHKKSRHSHRKPKSKSKDRKSVASAASSKPTLDEQIAALERKPTCELIRFPRTYEGEDVALDERVSVDEKNQQNHLATASDCGSSGRAVSKHLMASSSGSTGELYVKKSGTDYSNDGAVYEVNYEMSPQPKVCYYTSKQTPDFKVNGGEDTSSRTSVKYDEFAKQSSISVKSAPEHAAHQLGTAKKTMSTSSLKTNIEQKTSNKELRTEKIPSRSTWENTEKSVQKRLLRKTVESKLRSSKVPSKDSDKETPSKESKNILRSTADLPSFREHAKLADSFNKKKFVYSAQKQNVTQDETLPTTIASHALSIIVNRTKEREQKLFPSPQPEEQVKVYLERLAHEDDTNPSQNDFKKPTSVSGVVESMEEATMKISSVKISSKNEGNVLRTATPRKEVISLEAMIPLNEFPVTTPQQANLQISAVPSLKRATSWNSKIEVPVPRYEKHLEGTNRATFISTPRGFRRNKSFVPPKKLEIDTELYQFVPRNSPRSLEKLFKLASPRAVRGPKAPKFNQRYVFSFEALYEGYRSKPRLPVGGSKGAKNSSDPPMRSHSSIFQVNTGDIFGTEAFKRKQVLKSYLEDRSQTANKWSEGRQHDSNSRTNLSDQRSTTLGSKSVNSAGDFRRTSSQPGRLFQRRKLATADHVVNGKKAGKFFVLTSS